MQLTRWAAGQVVEAVHVLDPAVVRRRLASRPSDAVPDGAGALAPLVGCVAGPLSRHGKRLGWSFGSMALLIHFGMTGRWVHAGTAPPMARLGLQTPGGRVWFVDGRRFGCVTGVASSDLASALAADLGPDALDDLDGAALAGRLRCRKPVKVAMLEQERVAGIGNIHAAEACFRAHVAPEQRADTLTSREWEQLARAIGVQLRAAIEADADNDDFLYVNLGGPNPFAVYDRAGQPCPVCSTPIDEVDLGGRATFWCPSCQPARDAAPASS